MTTTAISLEEMVGTVTTLVTFPEVALRVDEAIGADEVDAKDISKILATDPALTAALLRLANSAGYQTRGTVDSVERAIMTVGFRELRDLVFAVSATRTFQGIPNELISVEDFWRHSLNCAVAAQQISMSTKRVRVESAFTKGLLHDIGHLVMFNQAPELSRQALEVSLDESDGLSPHHSEREVFGYDHAEVGGELAKQWRFPAGLEAAIRWHHAPFEASRQDGALLIHVANSVAVLAETGGSLQGDAPALDDGALEELGFEEDMIGEILQATCERVDDLLRIFLE